MRSRLSFRRSFVEQISFGYNFLKNSNLFKMAEHQLPPLPVDYLVVITNEYATYMMPFCLSDWILIAFFMFVIDLYKLFIFGINN